MPIDFTLNGKKYELHHPYSRADWPILQKGFRHAMGQKPRMVYLWDCALEPGGNLSPPTNWSVEYDISFIRLLRRNGRPIPKADNPAAVRQMRAYLRGTNIKASTIQFDLNTEFHPSSFAVPSKRFSKLMPKDSKYVVVAWTFPSAVWFRRKGTRTDEGFWLLVPSAVTFAAIQYGWCGEVAPERGLSIKWSGPRYIANEDKRVRTLFVGGVSDLARSDLGWTSNRRTATFGKEIDLNKQGRVRDAKAIQKRYAKALGGL